MKIISDYAVKSYLLSTGNKDSIVHEFIPLLVKGLESFHLHPDAVPERTVRASTTSGSDCTHLFMPCILPDTTGIKMVSGGPTNSQSGMGFQGVVTVLDSYTGQLSAVINAKTLTAFRTALASCVSLSKVFDPYSTNKNVKTLSVFGSGPQAYWHVFLAAQLYPEIEKINIISRSEASARNLAKDLGHVLSQRFTSLSLSNEEACEQLVLESSVIFGCTPSTDAIILKKFIDTDPNRIKFISLIGSYKSHMLELDLQFLEEQYSKTTTKIIVDSKEHCLKEAGELIQAKIEKQQLLSINEMINISDKSTLVSPGGIILQKIVGLSVMDMVVAKHLSENITGQEISDF